MNIISIDNYDINKFSNFAQEVFIDYYDSLIGHNQATYMANLFLSVKTINSLLIKGAIFKLVIDNNELVAFIEYIKEKDKVFLSKLYVRKDKRGCGIGKFMLKDCLDYAKENNKNSIYLTVNKGNTNSINVYLHLGFKIIDAQVNDIGNGYVMDDYICELQLN